MNGYSFASVLGIEIAKIMKNITSIAKKIENTTIFVKNESKILTFRTNSNRHNVAEKIFHKGDKMKKRMMCVLTAAVFSFVFFKIVQAHDYYAPYQNNSVYDENGDLEVYVPIPAINDDGTIDCCFCHYDLKAKTAPGFIVCTDPGETGKGGINSGQ